VHPSPWTIYPTFQDGVEAGRQEYRWEEARRQEAARREAKRQEYEAERRLSELEDQLWDVKMRKACRELDIELRMRDMRWAGLEADDIDDTGDFDEFDCFDTW
jgi:hypothetical protein